MLRCATCNLPHSFPVLQPAYTRGGRGLQHIQTPKHAASLLVTSSGWGSMQAGAVTVTMCCIITTLYYLESFSPWLPVPWAHVGCMCRMHRNKTNVSAVGRLVSPSARPRNRLRP